LPHRPSERVAVEVRQADVHQGDVYRRYAIDPYSDFLSEGGYSA